jgi:hypothetical protein
VYSFGKELVRGRGPKIAQRYASQNWRYMSNSTSFAEMKSTLETLAAAV